MNTDNLVKLIDSDELRMDVRKPAGLENEIVRRLRSRISREKVLASVLKFVTIEGLMIFLLSSIAL